ncbi:hypothetical protein UFOVP523_10 [uncultured Caudovirales phage]|uniref:Uncharacterized protein n=1 Tax=uncultured Caudovirales phage TaxID=2100421 RepID=A0A6J5MN54_9CAUD|nr:hypothetical protein UFOVP523_10 [uncultured Caudovirales phage]
MAETKTVNLNVETNLGSLKSQLKTAQREVETLSEKFGATSEAATNAARKAAQLKDAIGDAKALTDAFNPDAKFNALGGALSGVAGGFSAVEGAMGLVGVQSKDLEATMLKVQSAMALSQGINSIMGAKDAFINLKAVIGQTAIGQRLLTAAQVVGAAAMRVLNIVMAANPILLIVTAIGSLVGAFYLLTRSTDENAEAQKELNRQNELSIRLMKQSQEEVDKYTSKINTSSKNKIALAKAEGANSEQIFKLEKSRLEEQIRYRKLMHDSGTKLTAEQYAQQKQDKIDLKILDAQHNTDLLNSQKDANSKRNDINKSNRNKNKEDKKAQDLEDFNIEKERLRNLKNLENQYLAEKEEAENDYYNSKLTDEQLEVQNTQDKYFSLIEQAKIYGQDSAILEQAQKDELISINDKYRKAEEEKQKEADDKAKLAAKQLQDQKIQAVQNTLSTIGNLAELFAGKSRKQQETAFKIQKAANIANATIDTYKAAQGAYASLSSIPVVGVGLGIAAAGAALTAGLLNVKKIASTKFDGGGATGGGGGSTPSGGGGGATSGSVITPNFNIVGNNGTNQLKQLQQAPIQAYVVSGEMSTQQSLDRNRLRNATL